MAAMTASAADTVVLTFEKALDLVHAYSGSGDELQRAMKYAEGLAKSAPKSGYAEVIYAETLSTWRLEQDGSPFEVRDQVIRISNEVIRINPRLAYAHIPKARAFVRSSMYGQANSSIDAALSIDPRLSGALFLRAEIFRRTGAIADAEVWYRKFIASTSSVARRANGYGWLGTMYQDAARSDSRNRVELTAKARAAYEAELELDSGDAWKNGDFAGFLNDHAADFDAAERYALKALRIMEFPMARYHLAAAQYQKLGASSAKNSPATLASAAAKISESTGVTLQQAVSFPSFSSVVRGRLIQLQVDLSTK